jgi:hypothetical protein
MIEGACRFIEDRFGITDARWSPDGAEVILKLRAVVVNGDYADLPIMPQSSQRMTFAQLTEPLNAHEAGIIQVSGAALAEEAMHADRRESCIASTQVA